MPTTIASKIGRDSRTAGAMHELLAPCALVGEAVLTKRGDVFTVLRISPVDPECLEPDAVAAICHRFDAVLRRCWRRPAAVSAVRTGRKKRGTSPNGSLMRCTRMRMPRSANIQTAKCRADR